MKLGNLQNLETRGEGRVSPILAPGIPSQKSSYSKTKASRNLEALSFDLRRHFNDAMSITNLYFTSLFNIRSYAVLM